MTPEMLIEWILEGRVYDTIPSSLEYAEDARYVWPKRMETIVQWAKDAKEQANAPDKKPSCQKCGHDLQRIFCSYCGDPVKVFCR